jgi:hypothetical protein
MDTKFFVKFVGYWVVNTLVLALANSLFMGKFELGNAYINAPEAAVFSGFLLTTLMLLAKGLARSKMFKVSGRYLMFVYYWGAASAGVWVVARVANISGFGIARFTWAIAAGFAISLSNWVLRQAFKGIKMV